MPGLVLKSSVAASRKRWTRLSARMRAESSERATACSRQLRPSDSDSSLADWVFVTWEERTRRLRSAPGPIVSGRPATPAARTGVNGLAQTAGSTSMSMLAAPLSGTLGWRHTSTGKETLTRE